MKKLAKKLSILCMMLVACLTLGVATSCDSINGIVGGITSAVEDTFHECDYVEIMYDENNHWNECDCGEKEDIEKHSYSETVTKQATCTEAGEKQFTCLCGYSYTEAIPATGHTLKDVEGKEATCTEDGYTAYKVCENCDYVEGKEVIEAAHKLVDVEAKAPTCTEDGYTAHKACTECDYTKDKEVLPAAHKLEGKEGKAATCTEDGYTAYKACTECDYVEGKVVLSARGHNLETVEGKAPTCTEDGYKAYQACTECPYEEAKKVIEATGHSLQNKEGKEPTCTEEGYTAYKACENCDYIEGKEVVGVVAHTLQDKEGKEATCTEEGYTAYKACVNCDYEEGKEVVEKIPHTDEDKDLVCDVCPAYLLPEVGQAFKFVLEQKNLNKTLYFAGSMNGYYYATTELLCEATDLYLETAEGGYYIYFMNGETKNYLYIVASGTYINVKYGETKDVWTYDEKLGAFVNDVNGTDYYIGTYKEFNTISASKYSFIAGDKASTIGVSNFVVRPFIDNHTCEPVVIAGKEATCIATGWTEGSECGICGKVLVAQEEIPVTEHSYTYGTCTICGYEHGTVETKPVEVEISFKDTANRTVFTTEQQVWEQNGIKVTNDKAASTSNVADYANPARFYKSSSLKIEYKGMTKLVFDCTGLDAKYVDPYKAITGATVTVVNGKVTVEFAAPVDVFEIAQFNAQARAYSITITALETTSADAHTPVKTEAKAATCTEAGNSAYWTCSVCGKYFSDAEGMNAIKENAWVIAALGHNYEWVVDQAPTFTNTGLKHEECTGCGAKQSENTEIPVQTCEHNFTATEAKEPTCTEAGNEAYFFCSACERYYTDAEGVIEIEKDSWIIAATGHTEVAVEGKAATCTEAGLTEGKVCSVCKEVLVAQKEVEALGHTTENGTCERCGETIGEVVPVAGGSADFDTIVTSNANGDGKYTNTYTTTNGWKTVNSAIQTGGATVMNPQYPIVGPDNTHKAVCLNGKTSAPGKVTSPTLTGGITKLTMNYTKMFTDTKLSVTITITDLTTNAVYTKVVSREENKNTKYVVWTEEWVLETPVKGNFTIEIVNNCPSNETGNKDRFTILDLTWEASATQPETHTHTLTATEAKAATCTEAGNSAYWTCSGCNKYFSDAEGKTEIEENAWVIPATGHTEEVLPAVAATCTATGLTEGKKCSVCEAVIVAQQEIAALGHTEEVVPAVAATCTEAGLTEGKKCSVCGEILVAQTEIAALGHTEEVVAGKAATCTEAGLTEGKKCSVCGEILVAQTEIAALGHTEEVVAGKAATCTEAGLTEGKKCSVCGEILVAQTEIAALGHTEEVVPAVAATCTETGLTEGKKCSVCEATLVEQTVVEALGHDEVAHAAKEVTCTEIGWDAYETCTRCDYTTYIETAALGHNIQEHDAAAPTCTEPGCKAYETCLRCDYTTYEEIPALGHTEEVVAGKAATCTATGLTEGKKCSVCEAVLLAQETIPALDHTYVEYVCSACGKDDPTHYFVMSIAEALAAKDGKKVQISGTVSEVNTAWSDQYNNITVTIVDANGKEMYVYRLKTKVVVGDIITLQGVMATHNESRQIGAGATATITGHDDSYDYVEMTVAEAIVAKDGDNVIVTGTVVEIETAYSSQYKNISVYIADEEGTKLYLYRLTGNVAVGKIIKVKGTMATYNGARQVTGGTFEEVGTHTCSKYTEATCKKPAFCVVCGTAKDDVLADHKMENGKCAVCGYEEGSTEKVVTVTKTMTELATANGWTNATTKQSFQLDDVISGKINGGSNTGKFYTNHIRLYATDSPAGSLTITASEGATIKTIKFTLVTGTYAFLRFNGATVENGQEVTINASSATFNAVKNGSDGKQVRLIAIEVVYAMAESEPEVPETPVVEYTATVTKVDGTKETFTFTEDTMATVQEEIKALLPANTADYTYAWDKEVVLAAANCEFTIVQTKVEDSETPTESVVLEIVKTDFTTTSYANNNKTHSKNGYSYTTNQVMQQNGVIQWQKNKGTLTIEGTFTKIEIVSTGGTFTLTLDGVAQTATNGVYDFGEAKTGTFVIKVGNATGKITSIKFYA